MPDTSGASVQFALPAADVADFLRGARVGVCPLAAGRDSVSDRFTSSLKLLQMMALGMPVVATDTPPIRAVATDGRDVLLVPPNDPEALAGGIGRLLADPDLAARLAAAARRTAEAYGWDARARRLEDFAAGLLAAPVT